MMLTEFLLARIAEDEAVARACPPWPWRISTLEDEARDEQAWSSETVSADDGILVAAPFALSGNQERATRDHIVRFDPARVLAECEAKRRIVRHHEGSEPGEPEWPERDQHCLGCADMMPCPTLRYLALPYVDHPDYDESWRP